MKKLKILLNKRRDHYNKRIIQRHGSTLYFLLARFVGKRYSYPQSTGECFEYRFKQHVFLVQDNQLQTYINKSISRKEEKLSTVLRLQR